jgi:hypothetical protein
VRETPTRQPPRRCVALTVPGRRPMSAVGPPCDPGCRGPQGAHSGSLRRLVGTVLFTCAGERVMRPTYGNRVYSSATCGHPLFTSHAVVAHRPQKSLLNSSQF